MLFYVTCVTSHLSTFFDNAGLEIDILHHGTKYISAPRIPANQSLDSKHVQHIVDLIVGYGFCHL